MGWPYQFINLSEADKYIRRQALDRYAIYAQVSALFPVALFLLYRIARRTYRVATGQDGAYAAIPNSPSLKSQRQTAAAIWAATARKVLWWLGEDIYLWGQVWGQRDQWLAGILWACWLLILCVHGTGDDYLHLTKRFGMVAASQFPIQYLLALKSLNPFAYVFRSSHERVNRWHRVLGRVIYVILCLHATFYLNYFIQVGILRHRLFAPIVAFGVTAFTGMSVLNATALATIRQYSYRLFFITHIAMVFLIPVVLLFHARPARTFMAEALVVFIADLVSRKVDTVTSQATLESIPGTGLVKISASIPYSKINRFRDHPGSHIYLSIPSVSRESSNLTSTSYLLFEFLFNPFTIASIDDETGDLTIVARHRGGPLTSALARFAAAGSPPTFPSSKDEGGKVPLSIEGPYGAAQHFPNLTGGDFDRVLLVAGGVGATFVLPLYRSLVGDSVNSSTKVEMVWAVRGAGDATWAVTSQPPSAGERDGVGAKGILDDENVHIFLTGSILESGGGGGVPTASRSRGSRAGGASQHQHLPSGEGGGVEMSALRRDRRGVRYGESRNRKRPDLRKVVDDVFRHGNDERVAVLVCGPEEMARELRECVGTWVMKGRVVWWHNESFGW